MRSGSPFGGRFTGRAAEFDMLTDLLDVGDVVTITGPPGIGKTALVRAVADARPAVFVSCLAGLSWRPYACLASVMGRRPTSADDIEVVVDELITVVSGRLLVVDDVQFADQWSLGVIERAAQRTPCMFALRPTEPTADRVLQRLCRLHAHTVVELGPMSLEDTVAMLSADGVDAHEATRVAAASNGHPLWARHAVGAVDAQSVAHSIAATVDRLAVPARTALAAVGLLGRPAHRAMLGNGVDGAVSAGLLTVDNDLVQPTHRLYGEIAAARMMPADRASMHVALAERLADQGEAARHFVLGGDFGRAATAARRAVDIATDVAERAVLSALIARCSGDAADFIDAAQAALDAGQFAASTQLVQDISADDDDFPAAAAIAARAARLDGRLDDARQWAVAGSDALGPFGGRTARLLDVERFLCGSQDCPSVASLLADCAGTAEEPSARVAAAAAAIGSRDVTWRELVRAAVQCARSNHAVAAEMEALWLQIVGLQAAAELGDGVAAADTSLVRASALGATAWARRFRAERQWMQAVLGGTSDDDETAAVDAATALRLADCGEFDLARGLLGRAAESPRRAAVASCLAWLEHDDATTRHQAETALDDRSDPIVVLLAGPSALWTGVRWHQTPSPMFSEAAALAMRDAQVSAELVDMFVLAGDEWQGISLRAVARCAWAAADAARQTDDDRAATLAATAMALVEHSGLRSLEGRVATVARSAGVHDRRRKSAPAGSPLTAREAEVLTHVANGMSSRQIAARLGVAATTVESHVRSAVLKLGSKNRREAAATMAAL